jgi:hypothetical protein
MRIKYIHKLEYKYEDPVQLGEHRLCIKPRSNGFQKLKNFELKPPGSHIQDYFVTMIMTDPDNELS